MLVYTQLIGSAFFWGATWISGRFLAQQLGPFSAALLRFLVASIFLFLWSVTTRRPLRLPQKDVPAVTFLGLTGIFLYNIFFFTGLRTVAAGRAALIIATVPVVICLVCAFFPNERLTRAKFLGAIISLTGATIILSDGNPLKLFTGGLAHGDLMILGCVGAWTAYSIVGSRIMRRLEPLLTVTWACFLGTLMLIIPALRYGLITDIQQASALDWGNIVFLGVIATGVAFTWYYNGIRALGPGRAGIFINLVPVFAIALGSALLDEPVTSALAGGGALVLFGVYLANRLPISGARGGSV